MAPMKAMPSPFRTWRIMPWPPQQVTGFKSMLKSTSTCPVDEVHALLAEKRRPQHEGQDLRRPVRRQPDVGAVAFRLERREAAGLAAHAARPPAESQPASSSPTCRPGSGSARAFSPCSSGYAAPACPGRAPALVDGTRRHRQPAAEGVPMSSGSRRRVEGGPTVDEQPPSRRRHPGGRHRAAPHICWGLAFAGAGPRRCRRPAAKAV